MYKTMLFLFLDMVYNAHNRLSNFIIYRHKSVDQGFQATQVHRNPEITLISRDYEYMQIEIQYYRLLQSLTMTASATLCFVIAAMLICLL